MSFIINPCQLNLIKYRNIIDRTYIKHLLQSPVCLVHRPDYQPCIYNVQLDDDQHALFPKRLSLYLLLHLALHYSVRAHVPNK